MRISFYFLLLLISFQSYAQITGGNSVYNFIELPASARIAALGGINQSISDKDVSLYFQNPALLNAAMNNHIHFNNSFFIAGTNNLLTAYSRNFKKFGYTAIGLQYMNYGKMNFTDQNGYVGDLIKAKELMLSIGFAKPINEKLFYGLSLKYTNAKYDDATGEALLADVGFSYRDTAQGLYMGIALKNFGTHFNHFTPGVTEALPFNLQAGIAYRVRHTPFLFSLTLHDLDHFDIRYNDPALQIDNTLISDTSQKQKVKKYTGDKILRHCVFATEINFGKVLKVDVGYNHLRRKELAFDERKSLSGFNFGFQLALKKIGIAYAYSIYNIGANANYISLYLNLDEWIPKTKS